MTEIIKQVAERAGISEDKAKTAVDVVLSQLKSRLPGPMAAQVEAALAGDSGAGAGGAGGVMGKLGG